MSARQPSSTPLFQRLTWVSPRKGGTRRSPRGANGGERAIGHLGLGRAHVGEPQRIEAFASDNCAAGLKARPPLALGLDGLIASEQRPAVRGTPARRLLAGRQPHDDEPAARLRVLVDACSSAALSAASCASSASICAVRPCMPVAPVFNDVFGDACRGHAAGRKSRKPRCLRGLRFMRRRGLEPPPGYPGPGAQPG
jgi:hypothetical protein